MGINVHISVDLEFLGIPHTKIRKPHLLTKKPNFVAGKELAIFSRTTIFCGHKTDRIVIQYAISSTHRVSVRHTTRIVFAETFAKMHCGQQCRLYLFISPSMIPQAHSFMEHAMKGPSMQGKSPRQRDLGRKQRIQDAHAYVIETKRVGINTFTGLEISTNVITKIVK